MAAESGGQSERDPLEAFIDEVFEEMVRDAGFPHTGSGVKLGKDPLAGALMEAAVASLSRPPSHSSELERMLFAQTLATALADSLAPALAEVLASEIMKVLTHHAAAQSGTHESVGGSGRGHRSSGGEHS
ncbi:hypothetical protein J2Z21_007855 [Streptomyces griseochromogenes]|uniref:Uncharacterized protein n=1 Tax=Streptomyces griseochromogenes TaxID=68214 RepID=A0A1B1BAR0_9ACTN|nr:hypothetical protein [Streptomyces griseochromogenes]ANP55871.1 hypothetical protein AVL59_45300 [Streptomyces griseochromogenes]MBP2054845.1 hypothetical protein [Streptomyces griseochromogenes]